MTGTMGNSLEDCKKRSCEFNLDFNISFKMQATTGVEETCLKGKAVNAKEALTPWASG